nr:immunoglobulin heavy chain junction region [Macaca mulatta]MOW18877.1 immunoglobulin heavy chain junction region [Macaca mulatta]MOW18900.1 immunoglobulin heavy chain junction region [Macaca mulatta]MOW18933.1 immunoglobulin heavy chain junction region [Macaca mulatta]MOW18978.1 immunoglobulin heavy chain junction region [Macaca mulatta]
CARLGYGSSYALDFW